MNLATILLSCALLAPGAQEAAPPPSPSQPSAQAPDSAQPSSTPSQDASQKCEKTDAKPQAASPDLVQPAEGAASATSKTKGSKAGTGKKRPRKIVVREGGTTDQQVQLSAGLPAEQATHQRQTTDQLLNSTEVNLRRISNRPLQDEQKAMVTQIRRYVEEAQAAIKAGDLTRGRNLALKAHLLSDELVPH